MEYPFSVRWFSNLFLTTGFLSSNWNASVSESRCLGLKSSLRLENTTILDASYYPDSANVTALGSCQTTAMVTVPLCRVQFLTNTSDSSAIQAEAWLPDEWYGRFMGLGNRGLGGCIAYDELDYGSSLHFATVASNNGHDGDSALRFLDNPEVLNDFAYRAIHVETVIGKQIVKAYYGRPHHKSYYLGCSTGGRQGTQAALKFPNDFDGIIAGAPATDFIHLLHWTGMLARYVGAPNFASSPSYISPASWKIIADEVLKQCDALDGVLDGIITEPDACEFRPEALLCRQNAIRDCLTQPQVEALRKIYSPLYEGGKLLYPRYDPGAEGSPLISFLFSGNFPPYTEQWLKYVVLNATEYDISDYGPKEGILLDQVDAGGISTFSGDFSAFRDTGGKFLTYHGRGDPVIVSGSSKRLYNLISRNLSMPTLDSFYRLFLVPGMDHCAGGPGASNFGQLPGTNRLNSSSHNIVLAMVDWVEGGVEPGAIIGLSSGGTSRVHCRYPMRSQWDGLSFRCEGKA
ncbi:tannase and feruloyl esterase [Mycena sp. CBHHK59/15]|nr:tannase and feruloyl esterase [Mycena sp. CBHHK59/15]